MKLWLQELCCAQTKNRVQHRYQVQNVLIQRAMVANGIVFGATSHSFMFDRNGTETMIAS